MNTLAQIGRGIHWSEQYGSHPGNAPALALIAIGLVVGGVVGALFMVGMFGPLYLIGAYERGKERSLCNY